MLRQADLLDKAASARSAAARTGTIALTGGTGFIGRHTIEALLGCGYHLKVLTRRPEALSPTPALEPWPGSLQDEASLAGLVDGADTVVHLAGATSAPRPEELMASNRDGTARLARLAALAGVNRFILVSSLAAGVPEVSFYARSKRESEDAALGALGTDRLVILRPPAVYGPGDPMTLPIFKALDRGFLVAPRGSGRFSLIHVRDLAHLLGLIAGTTSVYGDPIEADDGRQGGYSWQELGAIAGQVLKRRVRVLGLPRSVLWLPALSCDLLARRLDRPLFLSRDKLGELYHPDWVAGGAGPLGWQPRIDFAEGLIETLAWYRAKGWL